MGIPNDYLERVYAGVLGKIIGVYLGRPFEGWGYEKIVQELGDVWYYVHEKRGVPLIVTDDDISGTFTFLRALPDYGNSREITAEQIGQTWLNYLIEKRTVLWWGGMGNSTEHTAYLRLKHGYRAPESGSIALNGQVVAEQIGAQIFIDGWGMIAPGDPEMAADLARRAASVSHDGEAIYGAQVVAAMEAQAFVEQDIQRLIDAGVTQIPRDSVIYRLVNDLREWHAAEPDWRKTRERIVAQYGYDKYGGNCHMVPNHALIIHALLHGEGDFQKSLMIVNTCGWDTDCNSGNVGCLLGIRGGLAAIDAGPDWRGPVADRIYLPTADGGRAITDAAREAIEVVNIGRALASQEPILPKGGARFHFELPGSLQGFETDEAPDARGTLRLENVEGHSAVGARSLALRYRHLAPGLAARAFTATFIPPHALNLAGYSLIASPTLYPGQRVSARLEADAANGAPVQARLTLWVYDAEDKLARMPGFAAALTPGGSALLEWTVPDLDGRPVAAIGFEITSERSADGAVYLDYLTWSGEPNATFGRAEGAAWRRAWVNGVDHFEGWGEPYRLIQDEGTGLLIQGTREWRNYAASATITPHMVASCGIAVRVQGMRRYYALILRCANKAQLIKGLDGTHVLAETEFPWQLGNTYELRLQATGTQLIATIDGRTLFQVTDTESPLEGGAVALRCEEGRMAADAVRVEPADG